MPTAELIIDSFAGGGGASTGIERALGRPVDIAINHNADAIAMHEANHPHTRHLTEDVFRVNPRKATRGRPVGLMWLSPDCRHFSRAKGGKPVRKEIRGLAWVAIKWAAEVKPRVIVLENVREFEQWGPLIPLWKCECGWKGTEGQTKLGRRGKRACPRCESATVVRTGDEIPDPNRKGLTFRQFVGRLKGLGYHVEWQVLNAADYGAPTHRRRLFLVARNDGRPIVWPDATHGDPAKIGKDLFSGDQQPWRTAAECIDWSVPVRSIFARKKPLAEKTLKRIAMGVKRYVLDAAEPFLVTVNHGRDEFRGRPLDGPLGTVTGSRGDALVSPLLARIGQTGGNGSYCNGAADPLTTVTSKAEHLLVAPCLYPRHGERDGQAPRCGPVDAPLPTVTQTANGAQLCAAFLARHFGGSVGAPVDAPAPTVTGGGQGKTAIVSAFIAKHFGGVVGCPAGTPLPTTTAKGTQNQLACVNLVHMNHGDKQWSGCDEPARTVTTGNHAALVYSFLVKYFGTAIGAQLDGPLHTITGKARFGLVTVTVGGAEYVIVDIGMRILRPHELAAAQGFPPSYVLTGSNTSQVERIGNSVCPAVACAIVRANCADLARGIAA